MHSNNNEDIDGTSASLSIPLADVNSQISCHTNETTTPCNLIATPEKIECYQLYSDLPIIIEGPEFTQDYTFFLVHGFKDLQLLEKGILLDDFVNFNDKNQIEMEFRVLQHMTQHKDHVKNLVTSPNLQFHRLNRYNDILPFKHNQLTLKEEAYELSKQSNDSNEGEHIELPLRVYINASLINSLVKGVPPAFIASQGPSESTISRFWQMVWEQKVPLIVMLCPLNSANSKKEESACYWREAGPNNVVINIGKSFTLEFMKMEYLLKDESMVLTTFKLTNLRQPEQEPHIVEHMHMKNWIDDKGVKNEQYQSIEIMIQQIKKHRVNIKTAKPIIVHCSAGIGRTGTLICIYLIIEAIEIIQKLFPKNNTMVDFEQNVNFEDSNKNFDISDQDLLDADENAGPENNENVSKNDLPEDLKLEIKTDAVQEKIPFGNQQKARISIFGTVRKLREQRWSMVKKQCQYIFIYEYLEWWVSYRHDQNFFNKDLSEVEALKDLKANEVKQ